MYARLNTVAWLVVISWRRPPNCHRLKPLIRLVELFNLKQTSTLFFYANSLTKHTFRLWQTLWMNRNPSSKHKIQNAIWILWRKRNKWFELNVVMMQTLHKVLKCQWMKTFHSPTKWFRTSIQSQRNVWRILCETNIAVTFMDIKVFCSHFNATHDYGRNWLILLEFEVILLIYLILFLQMPDCRLCK